MSPDRFLIEPTRLDNFVYFSLKGLPEKPKGGRQKPVSEREFKQIGQERKRAVFQPARA